ncbi:hypothetical protein JJQ72_11120 [Paenibacillus sp. F411]|uniref:hypothetical protein n=1 Tax=Paenibacillus sp. F411 TaxID=2820239 RepID=UPI001AAE80EA|nr:hypothetical protein [Paenibacillus sp. F411]MBO2944519.1 hypothetical protein [Paenibacillus sp. F411]
MPVNHYLHWTASDLQMIKNIASSLLTKQDMYNQASAIANSFGRTEASVCKKIEQLNGWFWA